MKNNLKKAMKKISDRSWKTILRGNKKQLIKKTIKRINKVHYYHFKKSH